MHKLKIYTSCKGIANERFDAGNINSLIELLKDQYDIELIENLGDGSFVYEGVPITHGSLLIFEFEDKRFRVYDFGDYPKLTVDLSSNSNFDGAAIGQYNKKFWDSIITDENLRNKIKVAPYAETYWNLGKYNYSKVTEFRETNVLDQRLHWRGSLYTTGVIDRYKGIRKSVELLPVHMSPTELNLQSSPIPFWNYIQEAITFETVLSIGGGSGISCGDYCFRDIEMFGLGIPVIRPQYAVEHIIPLIPNVHYISVDAEFESNGKYKNHEQLSKNIADRYREVINDKQFLKQISINAHAWYVNAMIYPNITKHLIQSLGL